MFWRFGFQNPSAIDTLLDREDIELEDILEEEDLLQEAKSHNQKLVDFLCRPENLEKLLNYITATDLDESRRFKYPFLSCEIIACEIPQIVDAIVLERKELLESFWSFLDRPAPPRRSAAAAAATDDDQAQAQRKEHQEEAEEQDKPVGLDSLQAQYFCKTISVFLTKRTAEVLEFIKAKPENLDRILAHLQTTAIMDLLLTLVRVEELSEGKGIVQWLSDHGLLDSLIERLDPYLDSEEHSVAQQCISEIIRISQTSLVESPSIGLNDLIIDLKSECVIRKLTKYMLDAKAPNSTSTLINGVTIIIDLIRHNNSDMDNDPMLNGAYGYSNTMVRQTSVSLADMLKVLADHVGDFKNLLIHPRSVSTPMKTTLGEQLPLGFERLKICELFAELLHCSNMTNLNTVFDDEGSEQNEAYEKDENNNAAQQQNQSEKETAEGNQQQQQQLGTDSKQSSESLHADDGKTTVAAQQEEEEQKKESQQTKDDSKAKESNDEDLGQESKDEPIVTLEHDGSKVTIGDYLKIQFVEHRVMPTCIDLFFAFPWNNFLHYVIYDMLHQVFNGRMDKGYNRHLAISVFKDGKLTDRMVASQKENDEECAKPKGMRLGYMGHLTFIADEIIKLFEGYPETIVNHIKDDIDLQSWNEYCANQLRETKERDRLPLAGPRPNDGMDAATDEDEEEETLEGTAASQYSRYLAQHADGGLDDDEDEETENWITGRADYDREYSYGGAFGAEQIAAHRINSTRDELDEDEEYGSDEDEESGRMPADWSRNFAPFPQNNMLHRTQSHLHENEDEGANDSEFFEGESSGKAQEDEDDPFGDFTSCEDQGNNQDWNNSFADHFESIHISDGNKTTTASQHPQQQQQLQSQKTDQPIKNEQDYVRAIKTKEEQDVKLAKEYSPEEEQQGEI